FLRQPPRVRQLPRVGRRVRGGVGPAFDLLGWGDAGKEHEGEGGGQEPRTSEGGRGHPGIFLHDRGAILGPRKAIGMRGRCRVEPPTGGYFATPHGATMIASSTPKSMS